MSSLGLGILREANPPPPGLGGTGDPPVPPRKQQAGYGPRGEEPGAARVASRYGRPA